MGDSSQTEETIAILFADVVDSSRLYATYGDAEARRIVGGCLAAMTQVVGEQQGRVVKTIGDEIMCTFATADQAVLAGVLMHQRLAEQIRAGALHNTLSLRIGLHRGPAVREGNDVFGDAVNLAARMAALSKAHQIMTTRQTVEALEGAMRPLARFVDQSTVKGQQGAFDLYEIVWNTSEATMASSGIGPRTLTQTVRSLDVRLGDKSWTVDLEHPVITMGRSSQCDVFVDDTRASRLHAKIEYGRERFLLRDVSTNGTYLQLEATGKQHIRRDEAAVSSNGLVMLGREVDPDSPLCIRLTLREEAAHL
ncbi:MAG TPA: adenylate/guanylate cyclase domain-containing protein [Kiritimatiellia bacterium]|nr:adenylate/guanylate cyclase domain-containing protein [Kiritimatiellia bacterium]